MKKFEITKGSFHTDHGGRLVSVAIFKIQVETDAQVPGLNHAQYYIVDCSELEFNGYFTFTVLLRVTKKLNFLNPSCVTTCCVTKFILIICHNKGKGNEFQVKKN